MSNITLTAGNSLSVEVGDNTVILDTIAVPSSASLTTLGTPTDGSLSDGLVALTSSTSVVDAIDGINEALLTAGQARLGAATDGSLADGYVSLTTATKIVDAIDALNEAMLVLSTGAGLVMGSVTDGSLSDGLVSGWSSATFVADAVDDLNEAALGLTRGSYTFRNLIPENDATYDLGSSAVRWRAGYFGPSSVHISSSAAETTTARDYRLGIVTAAGGTQGHWALYEAATGSPLVTVSPTGATALDSTLSVAGASSLAALTLSGLLSAASASLSGTLSVAGASSLGTLGAGATTLSGALSGTSAAFSSTLDVTGATTMTGALGGSSATFSGTVTANKFLDSTSKFLVQDATITNLEPVPATVRYTQRVIPRASAGAAETAGIYVLLQPVGGVQEYALYAEIAQQDDTVGGILKAIHYGAGDAMYVALRGNGGVALEAASYYNGTRGIIATNQRTPSNGTDFTYSTHFNSVWGDDGTGGSTAPPAYGTVYLDRSLGNSVRTRKQDPLRTGAAEGRIEWSISEYDLSRNRLEVYNTGELRTLGALATSGQQFPFGSPMRLVTSWWNSTAPADVASKLITTAGAGGTSQLDVSVGALGAESLAVSIASSGVVLPATNTLAWTGRGSFGATADGAFRLLNNAGATAQLILGNSTADLAGSLVLGAATSSGIAINKYGAGVALSITSGNGVTWGQVYAGAIYSELSNNKAAMGPDASGGGVCATVSGGYYWTTGSTIRSGVIDTGLERSSSGLIKVTDGSTGSGSLTALNLTSTGIMTAAVGSVSAPGYSFAGNAGSGLYVPATNELGLTVNGTRRLYVDSNGNMGVGYGSALPFASTAFCVTGAGSTAATNVVLFQNSTGAVFLQGRNDGYWEIRNQLRVSNIYLGNQGNAVISNGGPTASILQLGNVASDTPGWTTPSYTTTDPGFLLNVRSAGTPSYAYKLQYNSSDILKITTAGYQQGPSGAVGTPAYAFSADSTSGIWFDGTRTAISTGGAQVAVFYKDSSRGTSRPSILIGTTSSGVELIASYNGSAGTLGIGQPGTPTGLYGIQCANLNCTSINMQYITNASYAWIDNGSGNLRGGMLTPSPGVINFLGDGLILGASNTAARGQVHFYLPFATKTANYTVTPTSDPNTVFDNTGAAADVQYTLPTASALNQGMVYHFVNQTGTTYIKLLATGSDVIRTPAGDSAAAGYIRSNTKGGYVTVVVSTTGVFNVISQGGTWSIDS